MKISELVSKLQAVQEEQGDLHVLVAGYEGGADDVEVRISLMGLLKEQCDPYWGRYDSAEDSDVLNSFNAVFLMREKR